MSVILGVVWLVLGGVSVALMLRIYGRRVPTAGRVGLARVHKACGAAFTLIYVFFLWVMVAKASGYAALTALQAVH
ncbi:MAG: hypothetical protein ACYTGN_12770, partial [Planctomycetota bacterium]